MIAQLLATRGLTKAHSRPRTSNDNAYSETQFKMMKYCPDFPARFKSMGDAVTYYRQFFRWYNTEHYHTGLGLLTPEQVHYRRAQEVINARNEALAKAYETNPERFARRQPPTKDESTLLFGP